MTTRVCEICFDYFATSSDIVAHYKAQHQECDTCGELALADNACASHKGECFDCCGCGELEEEAGE
jgi:hypothetical protein